MLGRTEIARLVDSGNMRRAQLAKALESNSMQDLSAEERRWIDRIEALRDEICSSTERISYVDYGAGSRGLAPRGTTSDGETVSESWKVVGEVCRSASKPAKWASILFRVVRATMPESSIEMGTALGISGAYQAAAHHLNERGKMVTLEGSPAFAEFAVSRVFAPLGLDRISVRTGEFKDTLPEVLPELQPIDYAFIDGHHEEHATVRYFEQILPYLAPESVLVFDDIHWSNGMSKAWERICNHSSVTTAIDFGQIGLCIANAEEQTTLLLNQQDWAWRLRQSRLAGRVKRVRAPIRRWVIR